MKKKSLKTLKNKNNSTSTCEYITWPGHLLWPVLSTGKTPHDKRNRNCLGYNQNLFMSPGGVRHQEGLTDYCQL